MGIEPTNDGYEPSAITILAIRSIAVGAFSFENAAVWHCKTQTALATRHSVRSLTILPADASHKTPLVIITKRLSPFIVRPEARRSISELMLIVWIAVGVFHKAHSCSNFAKRLVGDSSYDFKSYASWCCCLRFSWS